MKSLTQQPPATYTEWTSYLKQLYGANMKLGLDEIQAVLSYLGNPQDQIKTIHIVGTNGKGSVSAMLSSIYTQGGYKTGLFISPHLLDIRERIQINSQWITEAQFVEAAEVIAKASEATGAPMTYFTFINAMAFWLFKQEKTDIAIIETGMGGRLDSTNVIKKPEAIVVTAISYDHTKCLGPTLTHIATEKAGVFKPDVPVIVSEQPQEALQVIQKTAAEKKANLIKVSSKTVQSKNIVLENNKAYRLLDANQKTYSLNLLGRYQHYNVALVLQATKTLQSNYPVNDEALKKGLAQVYWPGRFQYFPNLNLVVDGSHNAAGIQTLLETLEADFKDTKIHFGLSLLKSREINILSPLLTYSKTSAVTCFPGEPADRFHDKESFEALKTFFAHMEFAENFSKFLNMPTAPNTLKLLTGSLYTAGEVLNFMREDQQGC